LVICFAVILTLSLSKGKDPDEAKPPQPLELFPRRSFGVGLQKTNPSLSRVPHPSRDRGDWAKDGVFAPRANRFFSTVTTPSPQRKGMPSGMPKQAAAIGATALPKASLSMPSPASQEIHNPTPQNLVKPPNHLTYRNKTTSSWHTSFAQTAIMETEIKESPGQKPGLFLIKPITITERII
jgi:hypothetical protein